MRETISGIFAFFYVIGLFAQKPCPAVDSIVKEMAREGKVSGSRIKTGLSSRLEVDSQYLRYEVLQRCAGETELIRLLGHDSTVVVAFAWKAYLLRQPVQALHFMLHNKESLRTKWVRHFLNLCQGTVRKRLLDYMEYELYDKLLAGEFTLPAEEIVEFLRFREARQRQRAALKEYGDGF